MLNLLTKEAKSKGFDSVCLKAKFTYMRCLIFEEEVEEEDVWGRNDLKHVQDGRHRRLLRGPDR